MNFFIIYVNTCTENYHHTEVPLFPPEYANRMFEKYLAHDQLLPRIPQLSSLGLHNRKLFTVQKCTSAQVWLSLKMYTFKC